MLYLHNLKLDFSDKLFSLSIKNGVFEDIIKQNPTASNTSYNLTLDAIESKHSYCEQEHHCDGKKNLLVPAAIDIHVHSRDPGATHKENWSTIGGSAFKGGITALIDMPNTYPPTLTMKEVETKKKTCCKQLTYKQILSRNKRKKYQQHSG